MQAIKLIIRLIFKVPVTLLIVLLFIFWLLVLWVMMFFEWVYNASDLDREVSKEMQSDAFEFLKRWFTTI